MELKLASELYQDPELLRDLRKQGLNPEHPMDVLFGLVDNAVQQPDIVQAMDEVSYMEDRMLGLEATFPMIALPSKVILDNYGPEMLVWAWVNAAHGGITERHEKGIEQYTDYDPKFLEKASLWQWRRHACHRGKMVLAQYDLMESVHGEALRNVDLEKHVHDAALPGVEISAKRAGDYSLLPLRSSGREPSGFEVNWSSTGDDNIGYRIYLDAPTGFALAYKGRPNAVAAVALRGADEMMIYQMQGVQAHEYDGDANSLKRNKVRAISSRGLAPLDWRQLLVGVAEDVAAANGAESLGIQAGKHNRWTKTYGDEKAHITLDEARRAYDEPAKRLGFTKGDDQNWHRAIQAAT